MQTIQIQISNELAQQLKTYQNELPHILELGLRFATLEKKNKASSQEINLWQWLDKPAGNATREELDAFIQNERDSWI